LHSEMTTLSLEEEKLKLTFGGFLISSFDIRLLSL
jgi:hypothetical protein